MEFKVIPYYSGIGHIKYDGYGNLASLADWLFDYDLYTPKDIPNHINRRGFNHITLAVL